MLLGYARSEKSEDSLSLCRRLEGISKAYVTEEYANQILMLLELKGAGSNRRLGSVIFLTSLFAWPGLTRRPEWGIRSLVIKSCTELTLRCRCFHGEHRRCLCEHN